GVGVGVAVGVGEGVGDGGADDGLDATGTGVRVGAGVASGARLEDCDVFAEAGVGDGSGWAATRAMPLPHDPKKRIATPTIAAEAMCLASATRIARGMMRS